MPEMDAATLSRLRRNLRRWYAGAARDLPWRRSCDPYQIWVSEIMLQQTTVAAVVPYFERFLSRFPTVHELAAASLEDVLRLWEGLGYYSRARNLHRAAGVIVNEFGGRFPNSAEELRRLPGIGRYTAGAIASFAFDARAPIVEANTLRLYCRLLGYQGDPRSVEGQRILWSFAERILPAREPGLFNQALMEVGSTVCRPKGPSCDSCPLRTCCMAHAACRQDCIPAPVSRAAVTRLTHANVLVFKRGRVLLRQHGESERWAGLWDFPRYDVGAIAGTAAEACVPERELRAELSDRVRTQTGVVADVGPMLSQLSHSVTRYRIRLLCFPAEYRSGRCRRSECLQWVPPSQLHEIPLTRTARKLAEASAAGE